MSNTSDVIVVGAPASPSPSSTDPNTSRNIICTGVAVFVVVILGSFVRKALREQAGLREASTTVVLFAEFCLLDTEGFVNSN